MYVDVHARHRAPSAEKTEGNLLAALLRSPAAIGVMQGDGDRLLELDLSPDGRTLAVGDNDGTVVFLDPKTRRRVGRPIQSPGSVTGLVFTPDGSQLVIAGGGGPIGFVRLYDARSRAVRAKLRVAMREGEAPAEAAVSPDGELIAVGLINEEEQVAKVVRWNARTGKPVGRPVEVVKNGLMGGLAFTRNGKRLLVGGDGHLTVWDARSMTPVRTFPGDAFSIATAPDGRTVAFGAPNGTVTFLDLVTRQRRTGSGRHAASVQGVAFSRDGKTLVSTGDDRKVIVWDVASGTERETLEGHAGRVHAPDFSRDDVLVRGHGGGLLGLFLPLGVRALRGRREHLLQGLHLGPELRLVDVDAELPIVTEHRSDCRSGTSDQLAVTLKFQTGLLGVPLSAAE